MVLAAVAVGQGGVREGAVGLSGNGTRVAQPGRYHAGMVDANDGLTQRTVAFHDLVPPEWVPAEDSELWTAAYRVLRAPVTAFPPDPPIFDFGDVRAVVLWGTLHYLDTAAIRMSLTDAHQWQVDSKDATEKDTPESRYVVFLTRLIGDSDEPRALAAVAAARGLMIALNGRNMAWDCVYENIVRRGQITGFSRSWENPLVFKVPDLTAQGVERISRVAAAYRASSDTTRARLALSLRWLESAMGESGVDAVVKFWVALETLAMPDTANIRPVNDSLQRAYQMPMGEVQTRFGVGRVAGLRSRIVHEGAIVSIHQNLIRYLEALYTDVLLDQLGQPPERLALAVLGTPGFDLPTLLHQ